MRNKLLTKIAAISLGLAMAIGVSVGVANNRNVKPVYATNPSSPVTIDWTSGATQPTVNGTAFTTGGTTAAFATDYFALKSANAFVRNVGIWDANTVFESLSIVVYGGENRSSAVDDTLTVSLVDSSGTLVGSLSSSLTVKYASMSNGTQINNATVNNGGTCVTTYTFSGSGLTSATTIRGIKINLDAKSSNYILRRVVIDYSASISGGGPTSLTNPNPQYDDSNKTVSWTTDAHAVKYQIKVDDAANYSDINTETYDASGLTTGQQHTVFIKAVGDGENYSSSEGSVAFTPTAPFVSKNYILCTSTTDLEAGANYIVTSGISGTVKAMSTSNASADYRSLTDVTANESTIASTQETLTVALGGSSGAWTFHTNNYAGTDGYLASGTGNNNYLRVIASADNCTISFNGNAAVITFSSNASRNILRYNSSNTRFACYAAGNSMADVYLWREYTSKTVSSLNVTGSPTKLSGYFDSDEFDPTGITAYQAVYSDESTKTVPASDIVWPALVANMGTIRGSYTERGTTVYTPTYNISVAADSLSIVLSGTMVTSYYTTDTEWDKGDLVVTAQYASGNSSVVTASATFTYYSNEAMTSEVASPTALGAGENQTIYVKATYETLSNTVGYAQTVSVTVEHGTLIDDPLTAGQAFAIGSALSSGSSTTKLYYVAGVVSEIVSNQLEDPENKRATFWLQNGNEAHGFEAYDVQPDAGCTNYSDLRVGAEVLLYCTIKKYSNTTIENGSTASILTITYTAPTLTDIVLNKSELLLGVGEEQTLTVSPTPVGAELGEVTWISSNGSAATVNSSGKVTAVGVGTTTITVSAGGFSKTCAVTVFEKAVLQFVGDSSVYANTLTSEELTEALNLDTNTFEITYNKNGASNEMYLAKDEGVRMYATKNSTNGNKFTVTSTNHIIERINITFTAGASVAEVSSHSNIIEGTNGAYVIGADEFTLFDNNSAVNSNTQVKFSKIEIFYRDKNATETVESSLTQTRLAYHYSEDGGAYTYSNISIRFGGLVSKAHWNEIDTNEHVISGFGVMIASGVMFGENDLIKENLGLRVLADDPSTPSIDNGDVVDYYMSKAEMATPVEQGNNYIWNLFQTVDSADINKVFVAVAYIKVGDNYIFMNQVRYSVKSLASDYLANRNCDDSTAGGSLANLAA